MARYEVESTIKIKKGKLLKLRLCLWFCLYCAKFFRFVQRDVTHHLIPLPHIAKPPWIVTYTMDGALWPVLVIYTDRNNTDVYSNRVCAFFLLSSFFVVVNTTACRPQLRYVWDPPTWLLDGLDCRRLTQSILPHSTVAAAGRKWCSRLVPNVV